MMMSEFARSVVMSNMAHIIELMRDITRRRVMVDKLWQDDELPIFVSKRKLLIWREKKRLVYHQPVTL